MAENKTKPTDESVCKFLETVEDKNRRSDCYKIAELMHEISGAEARMWGDSIVGFGSYRYRYASGREGDWFLCGFSPRKRNLSLYIMCDLERYAHILNKLGKYKNGKGCLYINKLDDVDEAVLFELIETSTRELLLP